MNKTIALWANPRSLSTTMEQIMRQRGDFKVFHQPFAFLYYRLSTNEKSQFANVSTYSGVKKKMFSHAKKTSVFFKDICHFCDEFLTDTDFLRKLTNTFIIRDPAKTIVSHHKLNPNLTMLEVGNERQYELFQKVMEFKEEVPVIIDADDLENKPIETVKAYCDAVGIPFIPGALHWSPELRQDWFAKDWYRNVEESSGVCRQHTKGNQLDIVNANPLLKSYYEHHLPFYKVMYECRLIP